MNRVRHRFRKIDSGLVYSLVVVGNGSVDFLEELRAARFPKNDLKPVNQGMFTQLIIIYSPNKDLNAPLNLLHLMNNKVYYSISINHTIIHSWLAFSLLLLLAATIDKTQGFLKS